MNTSFVFRLLHSGLHVSKCHQSPSPVLDQEIPYTRPRTSCPCEFLYDRDPGFTLVKRYRYRDHRLCNRPCHVGVSTPGITLVIVSSTSNSQSRVYPYPVHRRDQDFVVLKPTKNFPESPYRRRVWDHKESLLLTSNRVTGFYDRRRRLAQWLLVPPRTIITVISSWRKKQGSVEDRRVHTTRVITRKNTPIRQSKRSNTTMSKNLSENSRGSRLNERLQIDR